MRILLTSLTLALAVAMLVSPASAQDCTIGVYADEAGTQTYFQPTQGEMFDVYVVMYANDVINAVALDMFIPGLGTDVFSFGTFYGPNGTGINVETPGGDNIGLGECVVGVLGDPILVSRTTLMFPFETIGERTIVIGPNEDTDPNAVIYNSCIGDGALLPCNVSNPLLLGSPIATESESWGAVKSLY
jgi:hypothetical protein